MDATKRQQVINAIAAEINKIPANTPMDHGTVGASQHQTKRESYAEDMARYIVERIEKINFSGSLYENWTDAEKAADDLVKDVAMEAVKISGR